MPVITTLMLFVKKLKQSEMDSLKQINSLAKANEYLEKYVNQEEKKKSKLKTERNILLGALATAIIVAVSK